MKRLFFLLLVFPMTIFSQNQSEYVYYKDSLQGYPHPYKFHSAEKNPQPINMDDVKNKIPYRLLFYDRETMFDEGVLFKILVDEEGCYVKHLLLKGSNSILLKEIEPYIPLLRFTPAIREGKPVKFWINVPFKMHFR